jgi:3-oxoacyl-[acyl-carrier-protein] synthase-1
MVLTGCELVTPVGDDARQTCAAVRAGVSRLAELPGFAPTTRDPGWDPEEPVVAAAIPGLAPDLPLRARLVSLALQALRALPAQVALTRARLRETAVLVALPLVDPVIRAARIADDFLPELLDAGGLPEPAVARAAAGGHTAVFELLAEAERILADEEAASVILLAVDSYLTSDRLAWLDQMWRLRSDRNVDGFIPGEAAGALFLESQTAVRRRGGRELAVLGAVGRADETNLFSSDLQSTGRALGDAIGRAVADAVPGPCPWVLCDLNGESYRAYEWGMAMARLPDRLGSVGRLVHPADCIGDVGAATGAVLVGLAAAGFARGYAPAGEGLLWTVSDGPARAALRIEAPVP